MLRVLSLALFTLVAFTGCAMSPPDEASTSAELRGGRACTSSDGCAPNQFCTTEEGDCFSNCRDGSFCPAVCWGTCERDERETCGTATCGVGQVCCNASCGICTDPGGVCTQQACGTITPL